MAGGITASLGIGPTVPSTARMYDFWLGGKDHFAVDRTAALEVSAAVPEIKMMAPPEVAARSEAEYKKVAPGATLRTHEEILRFFTGLELVEPGLAQVPYWRPEEPSPVRCRQGMGSRRSRAQASRGWGVTGRRMVAARDPVAGKLPPRFRTGSAGRCTDRRNLPRPNEPHMVGARCLPKTNNPTTAKE